MTANLRHRSAPDQRSGVKPAWRAAGALLAVLVLSTAACGSESSLDKSPFEAQAMSEEDRAALRAHGPAATLSDVTDLEPLRQQFNLDDGAPRLILLLSPT